MADQGDYVIVGIPVGRPLVSRSRNHIATECPPRSINLLQGESADSPLLFCLFRPSWSYEYHHDSQKTFHEWRLCRTSARRVRGIFSPT